MYTDNSHLPYLPNSPSKPVTCHDVSYVDILLGELPASVDSGCLAKLYLNANEVCHG